MQRSRKTPFSLLTVPLQDKNNFSLSLWTQEYVLWLIGTLEHFFLSYTLMLVLVLKNLPSYNSKPFILMCLSQITPSILQGKDHKMLSESIQTTPLAQMGILLWSDSSACLKRDLMTAKTFFRNTMLCRWPISTTSATPEPSHRNVPGKLKMAQRRNRHLQQRNAIAVYCWGRPNWMGTISGFLFWLELFSAHSLQVTNS